MLPTPFLLSSERRQKRSFTQDVIPFLKNIILQYTNPLSIEPIPLAREHCDSYLYYFRYKTLEIIPSQTLFQKIFNPIRDINTGTYYRTIHPQRITFSIPDDFITYMNKLIIMRTSIHHYIFLLTSKVLKENIITLKYQNFKQQSNVMIIPTFDCNKILRKLNNFNTDFFKTSYLLKI